MNWVSLLSHILLFSTAAPVQTRPRPASALACPSPLAASGDAVGQARRALTRLPVDASGTQVPPATQAAIEQVKDRLVVFVIESLACAAPGAPPAAIQETLARLGHALPETQTPSSADAPWGQGNSLAYDVSRPEGRPDLLAVTARLGLTCGEDDLLLLFGRRDGRWRPLIVRRSPPYRSIAGAFGGLQHAVSPPDRRGDWFLVTARVTPWCVSVWQGLRYDLSRAGPSPTAPRILFSHAALINIDNDDGGLVRASRNRFEIRYKGRFTDAAILTRQHVEAYSVNGLSVHRVAPIARNARDFADEWVQAPWAEAAGWSRIGSAIVRAHASLHALGAFWWLSGTFRCNDGGHEIVFENERTRWHLLVRGGPAFRLVSASRSSVAQCARPETVAQN